ncbi:hypothetical protein H072_5153 [Dactylellina haptotyla CBS 200.50]|uniref:Uncharacterized protein n=1 Tax=Dactylellina haptotyla (strain CBS 200.50) TaxID=1284197 RepID=S8ADC3_DACHA|nr:hypothetical protein H072_5153 [Dactylellina haptotyla CBS 200.50]
MKFSRILAVLVFSTATVSAIDSYLYGGEESFGLDGFMSYDDAAPQEYTEMSSGDASADAAEQSSQDMTGDMQQSSGDDLHPSAPEQAGTSPYDDAAGDSAYGDAEAAYEQSTRKTKTAATATVPSGTTIDTTIIIAVHIHTAHVPDITVPTSTDEAMKSSEDTVDPQNTTVVMEWGTPVRECMAMVATDDTTAMEADDITDIADMVDDTDRATEVATDQVCTAGAEAHGCTPKDEEKRSS